MLNFMGLGSLKTLAIVGAVVVLVCGVVGVKSYNAGKRSVYATLAANAIKIEKLRKKDDVATQILSDFDVCVRDLKSRSMPVGACDGLRGLQTE